MQQQSPPTFAQRENRVLLLRELISSFQQAQRSIVLADLQAIDKHLNGQHKLCLSLLALGDSRTEKICSDASTAMRMRWDNLTHDLREMERRAHHLGLVQAALLRRSRRAQELMARMVATTAMTYSPPVITQSAAAGK